MENDTYFIVCNPCNEQVIAKDVSQLHKNNRYKFSRVVMNDEFVPIVLYTYHGRIYKCPQCFKISDTVQIFTHSYTCSNKNKYPLRPYTNV